MTRFPTVADVVSCLATIAISIPSIHAFADDFDPFSTRNNVSASPAKDIISHDAALDPCHFSVLGWPLGLLEAVERALCHNPQTRQEWANVKAQAAQVGISHAAYFPRINATLSASRSNHTISVKDIPQLSYETRVTTRDNTLSMSWTLFDFGLRSANLENAQQLLVAACATQDDTLQTVFLTAAQAYYDLLTAQGTLDASKDSENSARESFLAAKAKYVAGVGTFADKLQAQTTFAQASLSRVKADGEFRNAQGALAVAMGLNANTPIVLDNSNAVLPDNEYMKSVDTLIEIAIRSHPSLRAARARLLAAQTQVASAKAEGLPSISLTGSIDHNDQLGQYPADTFTRDKNVGIQLNIPLFEGLARSYRIQAARAQVESRIAELSTAEQQVSLNVWKSYQSLSTETENLQTTDDLLQSATQSFKVAQGRYKAGVGNILELLNAQSALASAQQQRIQALSNWRTARLKLAGSLGKLGLWAIQ